MAQELTFSAPKHENMWEWRSLAWTLLKIWSENQNMDVSQAGNAIKNWYLKFAHYSVRNWRSFANTSIKCFWRVKAISHLLIRRVLNFEEYYRKLEKKKKKKK